MPKSSNYKYEFVTPETRLARINERLRAYEEELVNAQINLAVDEAAYANTGTDDTQTNQIMQSHQASLAMTMARIEAAKKLRAEAEAETKTAAP